MGQATVASIHWSLWWALYRLLRGQLLYERRRDSPTNVEDRQSYESYMWLSPKQVETYEIERWFDPSADDWLMGQCAGIQKEQSIPCWWTFPIRNAVGACEAGHWIPPTTPKSVKDKVYWPVFLLLGCLPRFCFSCRLCCFRHCWTIDICHWPGKSSGQSRRPCQDSSVDVMFRKYIMRGTQFLAGRCSPNGSEWCPLATTLACKLLVIDAIDCVKLAVSWSTETIILERLGDSTNFG